MTRNYNRNLSIFFFIVAVALCASIVLGQPYEYPPAQPTTNAGALTSGTLDGDRLPAMSGTKRGAVPATGTPSGLVLHDNGSWAASGGGAHAGTHSSGSSDVVTPAAIGAMAVGAAPTAHASSHSSGSADVVTPAAIGALPANDASVTNARTPTAHATSHRNGSADALTPADIAAAAASHSHATTDITGTAVVTGDSRLSDARTPTSHGNAQHSSTFITSTGVTDALIGVTDVTTNNASVSSHGFFPKLPTAAGKYLRDDLSWQTLAGGGDLLSTNNLSDVASAATARSNLLGTPTANALKYLRVNSGATDYELATFPTTMTPTAHASSHFSGADVITSANIGAAATNQTMYIGTTSHAINRATASEALTGITSIDGSAATLTTARNIGGRSFNGSADIVAPTWKTGITTRDVTTASGTVNVAHGLGRVPSVVRVSALLISSAGVSQKAQGTYDGTNHSGLNICYSEGTSTAVTDQIFASTSYELGFSAATIVNPYTGANRQNAVITVDGTNIIFTWTKTGTVAAATAQIMWECQ